jgi:hypothetical protein
MSELRAGPPAELVVFSHPNHELAIFGLLQRWRPALLYLTDGGGADRVAQTQEGLRSIGLLERATFLDHAEASFYEALLERDEAFFRSVAEEIATAVDRWRPERVLCDAVEYYNPVHDLSLPLVLCGLAARAAPERPRVAVLEIPLIRQVAASGREEYAVQRPMASGEPPLVFELSEEEVAAKVVARDEVYTLLAAQLGPVILDLPTDHLATEALFPAREPTSRAADGILRYERRAELLLRQGAIERPITYAEHFLPIALALAGPAYRDVRAASTGSPV